MSESKPLHFGKKLRRDSAAQRFRPPDDGVLESEARYEMALQHLGELESIINCGPAVVFRWHIADGWPVECVSDNIDQFGYTADELMSGRVSWTNIIHADDVARLDAETTQYLREGRTEFGQDYRLVTRSGELRWIEARNATASNSDGLPAHINGIVLDVTDRKRADEQLRQKEAELAHFARLSNVGELATGLVHELSEPLSAIANYVEGGLRRIHLDTSDADALAKVLAEIAAETKRASETIHHFRHFVRKREPCRSTADANELVRDSLRLVAGKMRHSGIEVHLDLQDNLPSVFVDAVQMRQCLLNLVRNALDAMREGHSDQKRLNVATRLQSDNEIEIAVSDTGKGFVSDTSDRVFEPFFTTKDEGLGVGLSLTQSMVHSHGGRIWATPNAEHGVTFKFTLPIGDKE